MVHEVRQGLSRTMDPHQAWLILRWLLTLPLRAERNQQNALTFARYFARTMVALTKEKERRPPGPARAVALAPRFAGIRE
jgi:cystathionine beta-lyase/cystathionine gamma-synthase